MEQNFYTKLDLDIYPLINPVNTYPKVEHLRIPKEHITTELKEYLLSKGLEIISASYFYKAPKLNTNRPHLDVQHSCDYFTGSDYTRLNFIYYGKDSSMSWYKIKDSLTSENYNAKLTTGGGKYFFYKFVDVELACTEKLNGAYIIQVAQPHNILNQFEDRYCISIRYARIGTDKDIPISMAEARQLFL